MHNAPKFDRQNHSSNSKMAAVYDLLALKKAVKLGVCLGLNSKRSYEFSDEGCRTCRKMGLDMRCLVGRWGSGGMGVCVVFLLTHEVGLL